MNINEKFEILLEGVTDRGIFKAVFINGGPGSGKDYVLKSTLSGHGLTEVGSDKLMDFLTDPNTADHTKAKNVNELRQMLSLKGRNGLVINDPGDNHERTKDIKKRLERIGYDTSMIHVHVDDEVSKNRNLERSQKGGRAIPERNRKYKWDSVQDARVHHAKMFGQNYMEFDNSEDLRTAEPEVIRQKKDELNGIRERIKQFVNTQPSSEPSQVWIQNELENNKTPIQRKGGLLPHPNSDAAKQAEELGLKYLGKGRYGTSKNDRTPTHIAISDNLVEVPKPEKKEPEKKKLKEFVNESVSITITGDTVGEVTNLLKGFSGDDEYEAPENSALTLGKSVPTVGPDTRGVTLSNSDVMNILAPQESYILDQKGNIKIYLLKSLAVKDALKHGGSVYQNENGKGYVVKVKRGTSNASMVKESLLTEEVPGGQERGTTFITEEETVSVCQEECSPGLKSFSSFRKSVNESIDKGIESGLSMATSGENLTRPSKKDKDKLEELTGDDSTDTIGSQKEDELKKKGISLATFKSKKVI